MKEGDVLICKRNAMNYFIVGNKYTISDIRSDMVSFNVNNTILSFPINNLLIFFEPLKEYRKRIILDLL